LSGDFRKIFGQFASNRNDEPTATNDQMEFGTSRAIYVVVVAFRLFAFRLMRFRDRLILLSDFESAGPGLCPFFATGFRRPILDRAMKKARKNILKK
jgi:hypothetical protein